MPLNFKSNIDTFHVPYFNIIITSSVDLSASEHKNPFCIPLPYTKMFRRTAVFSLLLWGDMPSTVNNRYSNHVFLLFVPYIHTMALVVWPRIFSAESTCKYFGYIFGSRRSLFISNCPIPSLSLPSFTHPSFRSTGVCIFRSSRFYFSTVLVALFTKNTLE